MATGRVAFSGPTSAVIFHAILERTPPNPGAANSNLPSRFDEMVAKALEKDARFATKGLPKSAPTSNASSATPNPRASPPPLRPWFHGAANVPHDKANDRFRLAGAPGRSCPICTRGLQEIQLKSLDSIAVCPS